jgi:hypothetical protein
MLWIIFTQNGGIYISIAIFDIPPHAPKEVGVLNEFGKPQPNKLYGPIIFGTDLLAGFSSFHPNWRDWQIESHHLVEEEPSGISFQNIHMLWKAMIA